MDLLRERLELRVHLQAHPGEPLRVDAERLQRLSVGDLRRGFQVGTDNPLVGVEGRTALLHRLGEELADRHADQPGNQRPSIIADLFLDTLESGSPLLASAMLMEVLKEFSGIWPERAGAIPGCGDVWCHPQGIPLTGHGSAVPFHKLSQWLTYSLIEPLQWAGHDVRDIDGLTGLPEYRNGGLLLDFGVLSLKDPADWGRRHDVSSALVVEWRALTVALLDIIAAKMRARLGLSAAELPLAKVLEGGTWAAGRRIAKEKRVDGGPPLAIISDGTVF
jgi:hypothetical protein